MNAAIGDRLKVGCLALNQVVVVRIHLPEFREVAELEVCEPWSSWSSLECSPVCQAGDHGFESRRVRFFDRHSTQAGKAAKLKPS